MKMPERIDPELFAPCGMNCLVCYKHCLSPKPCAGCRAGDAGKPGHCRFCEIKSCAQARGAAHCCACPDYPCAPVRRLDARYRARYGVSLVENGQIARTSGVGTLLASQQALYRCPHCGGVISLHDRICSDCRREYAPCNQDH